MTHSLPLDDYLTRQYRFDVIADPDRGYVIEYPDLPGCMTQVDSLDEVIAAAKEIFELRIEAAIESGIEIPDPSYPETYSGKFVLRMPKSLHRRLAERAEREGVSLNQLTVSMIAERLGQSTRPTPTVTELTSLLALNNELATQLGEMQVPTWDEFFQKLLVDYESLVSEWSPPESTLDELLHRPSRRR